MIEDDDSVRQHRSLRIWPGMPTTLSKAMEFLFALFPAVVALVALGILLLVTVRACVGK
jgi:hypothetical protein